MFLPPFPPLAAHRADASEMDVGAAPFAGPLQAKPASVPASAPASVPVIGRWITASGNLEVDIAPCGETLCGTVTQVLGHRSMQRSGDMQPVDTRPVLGLQILRGLQVANGDDASSPQARWFGEIYNRENGRTYRCRVHIDAAEPRTLIVRPHIVTPLWGQTQRWHRTPAAPRPNTPLEAP